MLIGRGEFGHWPLMRSDAATDLDAFIRAKMERDHIPGLIATILKDRQTVWSKGFGWADIQRKVEMSHDTVQNIGSISKTFVGTAVMQLRERGLLKVEDDVNQYLDFSVRKAIGLNRLMLNDAILSSHPDTVNIGSSACGVCVFGTTARTVSPP